MAHAPFIVVSAGDPAGIGPEIAVKACASREVRDIARVAVVADARVVRQAVRITGLPLRVNAVAEPGEGTYEEGMLNVIDVPNADPAQFEFGRISALCGNAAYQYIEKSVRLALAGKAGAVATAPVNKESFKAAGIPYIGQTEIFGMLTDTDDPLTMFEVHGLRIFFLTRHVSLREACDLVTKTRIKEYVVRCYDMLRQLGAADGIMAVAGLNPHSGEHGLFGDEEVREIAPAVAELRSAGVAVAGPIGADSVFHLAKEGRYNSVLSLYHDQGHIAAKTLDFERTVSVTGGMPVLRTSVDHGTAFDIAGTGRANAVSMIEAIKTAVKYIPGGN